MERKEVLAADAAHAGMGDSVGKKSLRVSCWLTEGTKCGEGGGRGTRVLSPRAV